MQTHFCLLSSNSQKPAMIQSCSRHHDDGRQRYNTYILERNVTFIHGHTINVQEFVSSVPYHGVFGVLIPLLVTILQVHVQGTTHSLFQTHSLNMWISLVATVVYYFACAADMKDKLLHCHATDNSQFFNGIASISGSLSTVGFVSVLLSRFGGCIIFIAWGLVSIILVICKNVETIKGGVVWLYQKMRGVEKRRLPRLSV